MAADRVQALGDTAEAGVGCLPMPGVTQDLSGGGEVDGQVWVFSEMAGGGVGKLERKAAYKV